MEGVLRKAVALPPGREGCPALLGVCAGDGAGLLPGGVSSHLAQATLSRGGNGASSPPINHGGFRARLSVNLKLPQKDEVQQAIREASDPKNNPYVYAKPFIEWYVVELRMGKPSKMPVTVRMVFPNKNGTTYAQVSPLSQASVTIPKQTSRTGTIDTLVPVEDILERLTDIGIVLITLI
jgi:hypothetical protein